MKYTKDQMDWAQKVSREVFKAGGAAEAMLRQACEAEKKSRPAIILEYGDPREQAEETEEAEEEVDFLFDTDELTKVLEVCKQMTPGEYYVVRPNVPKPDGAPEIIDIRVREENQVPNADLESCAALLGWSVDDLQRLVRVMDRTGRTGKEEIFANAAIISWVGNNLSGFIEEYLELRELVDEYEEAIDEEAEEAKPKRPTFKPRR